MRDKQAVVSLQTLQKRIKLRWYDNVENKSLLGEVPQFCLTVNTVIIEFPLNRLLVPHTYNSCSGFRGTF